MGERNAQNRRQLLFGFHCGEQALGDLLGTAATGFGTLDLFDPITNFLVNGIVEPVIPTAQRLIFGEYRLQFGGNGRDALFLVLLEPEFGEGSQTDSTTCLHTLVHNHNVTAGAGREKGSAKREAINLAFDSQVAACTPYFLHIQWDTNDHPIQARAVALEDGFECFGSLARY